MARAHPAAAAVPPQQQQAPGTQDLSVQLLSSRWDFTSDVAAQVLTESTDFTVLGVLGPPGVGKSRLLNALCNLADPAQAPSHCGPLSQSAPRLGHTPFPTRQMGPGGVPSSRHASTGIQLRVASYGGERVVALDTQPLFSASLLQDLATSEAAQVLQAGLLSDLLGSGSSRSAAALAEAVQVVQSLQLAVFLLLACHVVTVVLESADDMRVLQLLQMAEIVARTVPDISLPPGSALLPLGPASVQGAPGPAVTAGAHNPRLADVVFVLAGQEPDDLLQPGYLQQQHSLLQHLMAGSGLGVQPGSLWINMASELHGPDQGRGRPPHAGRSQQRKQQEQPQQPDESGEQETQEAGQAQRERDGSRDSKAAEGTWGEGGSAELASAGPQPQAGVLRSSQLAAAAAKAGRQHIWALPELQASTGGSAGMPAGHARPGDIMCSWQSWTERLRARILSHPKRPFARTLSEREMLRAYERVWAGMQSSDVMRLCVQQLMHSLVP